MSRLLPQFIAGTNAREQLNPRPSYVAISSICSISASYTPNGKTIEIIAATINDELYVVKTIEDPDLTKDINAELSEFMEHLNASLAAYTVSDICNSLNTVVK